jgi:hypothetical protein
MEDSVHTTVGTGFHQASCPLVCATARMHVFVVGSAWVCHVIAF